MNRISTPLFVIAGFLILGGCAGSGQNTQTEDTSPVVAVIGGEKMTLRNFEDAYAKNNGGWEKGVAASLEERERFLDLLVKFKLKVREARARGLERDSSIQQELESYGASIATSYMLDKDLVEPNIKKLYERRGEEIRASHILIRFANTPPTPEDTAEAYTKAKEVIGLVPQIPFDSLATQYSRDQSVMMNRGDLGYFSSGRMVKEFEDAAYGMNVGEYSRAPVRTQFGYHIIKITDRRPASGSIRVSHILRRFSPTREDSTAVGDSVQAIYKHITAEGLDFVKAAQQYSQDPTTTSRGGDLGFIERSRIPEHIAAEFYSKPLGTVFEPMRFPYGYHIFKTIEKKPVLPFAEVERELRNQYQANRYTDDYTAYLHGLKKKLQFSLDVGTMYQFTHAFDTAATPSREGWSDTLDADFLQRRLLTIGGAGYSVRDAVAYIKTSGEFIKTLLTSQNVEKIVERLTEIKALEHEAKTLAERHPEFDRLMKEYEDGVLLFKIEQDEVWDKIDTSNAALRKYYYDHLNDYRVKDMVNPQEILVDHKSLADSLYRLLLKGEDFGRLAAQHTIRPTMNAKKGMWGLQLKEKSDITLKAWELPIDSISAPFHANEGWAIVKTIERQTARLKDFDEVATEVANSYREYASKQREQQWVEELKNKYGVTFSKGSLVEAFRRNPGETN